MRPSGIKKRSRKPRSGSAASRATHASREIMEADDIMRASRSNTKRHAGSWSARWCRFQVQKLVPGITNRYCSPSFETATSWPPQDEVELVETQQPHAEERATRASRSMGSKRLTDLS